MIFSKDHKAETLARIVAEVKRIEASPGHPDVKFRLATGNAGVMAATNEAVAAAQFPMLLWVFGAVAALCLLTFRSFAATLCILLPLGLASLLAYALMAWLEIGLKVGDAAGGGARRRHRRRLRDLHLQPVRGVAAPGTEPARDLRGRARDHRQRRALHRPDARPGGRDLGLLVAQVPGRHGDPAGLPVRDEHDRRDRPAAGAGPFPGRRAEAAGGIRNRPAR